DALMQQLFNRLYDRDGKIAARGRILEDVVAAFLKMPYFKTRPPKSAGREEYGSMLANEFLKSCRKAGGSDMDAISTATAFTAQSIALAFTRFVQPRLKPNTQVDYILSGGGAKNHTLMKMLREKLEPLGCTLLDTSTIGIPVDAKEAVAFALLAYYTWHKHPANVPSATGAKHPVILGQVTYV
ncbi:MAG TPA: anhydro-N-acetylmuramic acid kinase, partial [Pseudacidobacterium sp.]|nr:anhydro-N-acetylmuramic acid kinase [Pseudacidobacterium sp.]